MKKGYERIDQLDSDVEAQLVGGSSHAGYVEPPTKPSAVSNQEQERGASSASTGAHSAPSSYQSSFTSPIEASGNQFIDEVDEQIRLGFVRKVFGLLGVQLLVTASIIAIFSLVDPVTRYVDLDDTNGGHSWVFITSMIISTTCILGLACFPHQAKIYPNNYLFLGVFTLAESVLLGVVCAAFTAQSVLIAASVTALISLGLTLFAWTTKRDFTGAGPYLFMALWCLIIYGFILAMFPVLRSSVQTAYSLIGVVIFGFYMIYDVQLIIGGKHRAYRFGIDEHVFATLNVYLDIINLFLKLLQMFGQRR